MKKLIIMLVALSVFVIAGNASAKPKKGIKNSASKNEDALLYIGADQDKVTLYRTESDKVNDLHFRITHKFNEGDELREVTLSHVMDDATVNPGWRSSERDGRWFLAVEVNGQFINTQRGGTLGKLAGAVTLDVYAFGWAGDSNHPPDYLTKKGKTYQIELVIVNAKGEEIKINRQATL
jgi:hypothetical protein